MEHYTVVSFHHKALLVSQIGLLHIAPERLSTALDLIRRSTGAAEIAVLSTCNRVEYHLVGYRNVNLPGLLSTLYEGMDENQCLHFSQKAEVLTGESAVLHVLQLTASLHSAVVGEREILGQFREAYAAAAKWGYAGDYLRILERKAVETAKRILTETPITDRPVSVVNLAAVELYKYLPDVQARILVVGTGKTNTALCNKLRKLGYTRFTLFNRTPENGRELSLLLQTPVHPLKNLHEFTGGFDVLITCTASKEVIISSEMYASLLQGEEGCKILVDLAVPGDIQAEISEKFYVRSIDIARLKAISEANMQVRKEALSQCHEIIEMELQDFKQKVRLRRIEIALNKVPDEVRSIRRRATDEVFAGDLQKLDSYSRDLMERMLDYMEKKYISKPMLIAREAITREVL